MTVQLLRALTLSDKGRGTVRDFLVFMGGLCVLPIPLTLTWRCWYWLEHAEWPELSATSLGLVFSGMSYRGVEKLLNWLCGAPAESWAVMTCLLFFVAADSKWARWLDESGNTTK